MKNGEQKKRGKTILVFMVAIVFVIAVGVYVLLNNMKFKDVELAAENISVTSTSVNGAGALLTACAANRQRNEPSGQNQSPQLVWEAVADAASYVVIMFDEDANWLHWYVDELTETALPQGAYSETYVGPYPASYMGRHDYRIEVFALRSAPDHVPYQLNRRCAYPDIVNGLDTVNGTVGNILARGYIVGTYQHGDENQ